jgi:hypothetical protein
MKTTLPSLLVLSILATAACGSPGPSERTASEKAPVDVISSWNVGYADFPTEISWAPNADGRMEVFALTRDGNLLHAWQQSLNGPFGGFQDMGAHSLLSFGVVPNADGRLEVFALGGDRALYHVWQTSPNGGWNVNWQSLAGSNLQQITPTRNADGRLEVFAIGGDGHIYHIWQGVPNGSFGPWQWLGGNSIAQITVANDADGSLDLVALGGDHNPYRIRQIGPNDSFGSWSFVGSAQNHYNMLAFGTNADRRLELFGITTGNQIAHAWQTAPNGGFSDFASYPALPSGLPAPVNLAETNEADGRLSLFVQTAVNGNGYALEIEQNVANGGWQGGWQTVTEPWGITAGRQANGEELLFYSYAPGDVYYVKQSAPNGPWATTYVPPSLSPSSFSDPSAVWLGQSMNVSWSFTPYYGCQVKAHARVTEGATILYDADVNASGSLSVTPKSVGKVVTSVWASCAGVAGTTQTQTGTTEVDTAAGGGGPTCSGGASPQYYTFCLSSPDQTNPPQCWLQTESIVPACSESAAQQEAQTMATNWNIESGACPACE